MDRITIHFPYYNQPDALREQLDHYSAFSDEMRRRMRLFIVDDGSRDQALWHVTDKDRRLLDLVLYRIDIDIPGIRRRQRIWL